MDGALTANRASLSQGVGSSTGRGATDRAVAATADFPLHCLAGSAGLCGHRQIRGRAAPVPAGSDPPASGRGSFPVHVCQLDDPAWSVGSAADCRPAIMASASTQAASSPATPMRTMSNTGQMAARPAWTILWSSAVFNTVPTTRVNSPLHRGMPPGSFAFMMCTAGRF